MHRQIFRATADDPLLCTWTISGPVAFAPSCARRSMAPKRRAAGKRRAAAKPAGGRKSKRFKDCVDNTVEELICPITFELPVDPVTAEDGRVYERCAIEEWIARPGELKSPTLNTPMGPRLLPATQARNIIERMVRTGAISGPKAEAWSKKLAGEEEVKAVRAAAEGGDVEAMLALGKWYYAGYYGLAKDSKQAAGWFQRGDDLGHVTCTANLGVCYALGEGVEKDKVYAVHLYGMAAARGSERGCYNLAKNFAYGLNGLRKNARAATRWYRAMESATVRDDFDESRDKAAKWLREHAVDS